MESAGEGAVGMKPLAAVVVVFVVVGGGGGVGGGGSPAGGAVYVKRCRVCVFVCDESNSS